MILDVWILIPILLPIIAGIGLAFLPRHIRGRAAFFILLLEAGILLFIFGQGELIFVLFHLNERISLSFHADAFSKLFTLLVAGVFILTGCYSIDYMKQEHHEEHFYTFYLMILGAIVGLSFSANLISMYLLFELLTLFSFPLVLQSATKEAMEAAKKYLFYSIFGALTALLGIIFLNHFLPSLDFIPGGWMSFGSLKGNESAVFVITFFAIVGFGVKAGTFPFHGWLPSAHPVAPSPASAILSGIIVKAGFLCVFRLLYYSVGFEVIQSSWVQKVWMGLCLITIFFGSVMAYHEDILKKRLAYSTVSQVAYIMFGLSVMNPDGLNGALSHVVYHALAKNVLFLAAGAIIMKTGYTKVSELRGIGKRMPVTLWCFAIASLTLIGIPPAGGFISKWFLMQGSLSSGLRLLDLLGPIILLLSALLTAGYLLPVVIRGFFPGADYPYHESIYCECGYRMSVPMILLTGASIFLGMFPSSLAGLIAAISSQVF